VDHDDELYMASFEKTFRGPQGILDLEDNRVLRLCAGWFNVPTQEKLISWLTVV
jgi:hypothetical protein